MSGNLPANSARSRLTGTPISRRTFGVTLLSVGAGAFLTACGSDPASGSSSTSAAASPDPTTSSAETSAPASSASDSSSLDSSGVTASFPISITHKYGTTVVPSAPVKVVSVGYTEHDTLLALGVIPIAVTDWYGDQPYATWPWAQAALGDAKPEVLSLSDGFEFEKIAALQPDLIVGTNSGMEEADYAKLSAIAPTLAQSGDYTDYFEPWYIQTANIGLAVGLESETTALIDNVRGAYTAAAEANPQFEGKNIIFLQNAIYEGSAIAYQKGLSTDFLTDLGFDVPSSIDEYAQEGGQAYIPVENLSVLNDADVLIWGTEKDEDLTELEKVPGFNELTAVKERRSLYTGGELAGAIYFTSPLSLPFVLEQLLPELTGVIS